MYLSDTGLPDLVKEGLIWCSVVEFRNGCS
jgi:hypothetical protein